MAVITLSNTAANNVLTELLDLLDAGDSAAVIDLYTGTKPAGPDTAVSAPANKLLGTLTCSNPVGSVSSRSLTFSAITQDLAADDTGTAVWARLSSVNASVKTPVIDIDVTSTGGGGFLQLNTTSIVVGGPISISTFAITA